MKNSPQSSSVRKLLGKLSQPESRWSEKFIQGRIKAGDGHGAGKKYRGWIRFRDLSSKGTSSRVYSKKLDRMVTLFSNIELGVFLLAEFNPGFIDYWENFPLSREKSMAAAKSLRVQHPTYPHTKVPIVMTIDAIVTILDGKGWHRRAVDCKSEKATTVRTHQKLRIHAHVSKAMGMPHLLVTEKTVSNEVIKTIKWIRSAVPRRIDTPSIAGAFDTWPALLLKDLYRDIPDAPRSITLASYCSAFDSKHGLAPGYAMGFLRILLWRHEISIDLTSDKAALLPLSALSRPDPSLARLFNITSQQGAA